MRKNLKVIEYQRFFFCLLSLSLLFSCNFNRETKRIKGEEIFLKYAQLLTIEKIKNNFRVRIANPWDTLQTLHSYALIQKNEEKPDWCDAETIIPIPLKKTAIFSSVHLGLLLQLKKIETAIATCDTAYILQPELKEIIKKGAIENLGSSLRPDIERIVQLHPDAIFLSPFQNSGGYGAIERLNIPLIECADYMETSALGRAEWMIFYGLLLGDLPLAQEQFEKIEKHYLSLKEQVKNCSTRPKLLIDQMGGAGWYVPGGKSTMAQIYQDAGADYLFKSDNHSGSVQLPFESIFHRGKDADIWLIKYANNKDLTYAQLKKENPKYQYFKPWKEQQIYGCNTLKNDYYESTPFHPDRLLENFIQLFHPELQLQDSTLYYAPLK